ncbi:hypothetical protein CR513_43134, partial [Mucuna pruriens]
MNRIPSRKGAGKEPRWNCEASTSNGQSGKTRTGVSTLREDTTENTDQWSKANRPPLRIFRQQRVRQSSGGRN